MFFRISRKELTIAYMYVLVKIYGTHWVLYLSTAIDLMTVIHRHTSAEYENSLGYAPKKS